MTRLKLTPAQTPTWSEPNSLVQRICIEGDRGTGKTSALVCHFRALIEAGISPAQILILTGHRHRYRQQFISRLAQDSPLTLAPLQIFTWPAWVSHCYEHLMNPPWPLPLGLSGNETLLMLQRFYRQGSPSAWTELRLDPGFFQILLHRHWERLLQNWSWEEFLLRSQQLDTDPRAAEINRFLQAFETWLITQPHPRLNYPLQLQQWYEFLQTSTGRAGLSPWTHWLVEDLEQLRPLELAVLLPGLQQAQFVCLTLNPYAGETEAPGQWLLEQLPALEREKLVDQNPQRELASRLYTLFQGQPLSESQKQASVPLHWSPHMSAMLLDVCNQIDALIAAGTTPTEIVLISWSVPESLCLELEIHFSARHLELEIYRGSRVIQRDLPVNLLLSLLRLVCWQDLRAQPEIPRLTGFEMAQIFAVCLRLDPWELADCRREFQDRLSAWGQYLQQQTSAAARHLQATIQELRASYASGSWIFSPILIALWQRILLPALALQPAPSMAGVQSLIQRLQNWESLCADQPEYRLLFLESLFQGEVYDSSDLEFLPERRAVRLMSLHRLCELHLESDYQFWLDLSHSAWMMHATHPLNSLQLLSRAGDPQLGWQLEKEEVLAERRLGRMLRQGLRYARREARFFASKYDSLGQHQPAHSLTRFLSEC